MLDQLPHLVGYQAAGAAPIVLGHAVEQPETVATAIRIGNPASWQGALEAVDRAPRVASSGRHRRRDPRRLAAACATEESVFCEPASAAGVAGLLRDGVPPGSLVVCVLTGNGLKDPDTATSSRAAATDVVDADLDTLADAILHREVWQEGCASR